MKVRRRSQLILPLLFLLALPASAHATWTAPFDLSPPGMNTWSFNTPFANEVGLDATGRAFFSWYVDDNTGDRVQFRIRSAGGVLGPVEDLTPAGENNNTPRMAVNSNGDAVIAWNHGSMQARIRSSSGALSPIQLIAGPGVFQTVSLPQVAIDSNSNAVFVWQARDTTTQCNGGSCMRIRTRTRSADGTLSTIQTLSGAGQDAQDQQVASDSNGNAIFVWARYGGTTACGGGSCLFVQARVRSPSGALSPVQTISGPITHFNIPLAPPKVAVDSNGNAIFVWLSDDATTDCSGLPCERVQTRVRSPGGALSPIQMLSDPSDNPREPEVGMNPGGDAAFVWTGLDTTPGCSTTCLRIYARARSAAGALSAIQPLSAAKVNSERPQVGIDQNGRAVFVWYAASVKGVAARTRSAAGVLSTTRIISDTAEDSSLPQLAVNPVGNAAADWYSSDGTNYRIDGAAGP
jgi:hypothetical protein